MEHMEYIFEGNPEAVKPQRAFAIAGVVASGNLEVMMECKELSGKCVFIVDSAAHGFAESWKAVFEDFMERNKAANIQICINDNAASPAVVSMRLDQAFEALKAE